MCGGRDSRRNLAENLQSLSVNGIINCYESWRGVQLMRKKGLLLFSILGLCLGIGILTKFHNATEVPQKIVINEVCSLNGSIIRDGVYDCSDYIELYNVSDETLHLAGWFLSDDETSPKKYMLTEGTIEPGGYLAFYANGAEGGSNLPFKISDAGEKIFLSDPQGNLVDSVAVPELKLNQTYARVSDGAVQWGVKEATILASNDVASLIPETALEKPQFSAVSGFYEEDFYLTLSAKEGEKIYYTLDGSTPDETDYLYEEPVLIENRSEEPNQYVSQQRVVKNWKDYTPDPEPVDKAMIVRAIAVNAQGQVSEVASETYFVNLPEYESMTVISLAAEPEELFGDDGIFATGEAYDTWYENGAEGEAPLANFFRRGRSWEVEASMQFIEKGNVLASQQVGVRAQGNSGRSQALKRISLFSREEYSGNEYFATEIIGKDNVHSLMTNEYVSNVALPYLVADRDVAVQQSRTEPVALFINGEYWYSRYLMEKYNNDYFEDVYGVGKDNIVMMKNNQVKIGKPEHEGLFRGMQAMASDPNLTPDEKYEQLSYVIDLQSFIDYFSINVYLCNTNMNEIENYLLWRTITPENGEYGDTKWRWIIYDVEPLESLRLEYYGFEARAEINTFTHPQDWTGYIMNENSIFQGLKECEAFRKQFVNTFLDIANVNFSPENVEPLLMRYGLDMTWLESFFLKRFDYIVEDLGEEFSLTGTLEEVTLEVNDSEGGQILLNTTTPDLSDGSWSGRYYTDFPITVTAQPAEGYRFVGWEGSFTGSDDTIEVPVTENGVILKAIFEKM